MLKPLPEDRHRSPFIFAMLFGDLLPPARVSQMLNDYIAQAESKLGQLEQQSNEPKSVHEKFVMGIGRAVYIASIDFLREHRSEVERSQTAQAAE